MSAVEITRRDLGASELRSAATKTASAKQARRMLAMAVVWTGTTARWRPRRAAWTARPCETGRIAATRRASTAWSQKQVAQWLDEGADLARDGVVRWRCADLVKRIKLVFDLDLQEGAAGRLLKKPGYSRLSGRPLLPQSDLEAQEVLRKTSRHWRETPSRRTSPDAPSRCGSRTKPGSASMAR